VSQNQNIESAKILVIEDEAPLRTILQMTLQNAKDAAYVVRTAADGMSGLAEVQRDPPDLILLDIMMPGMDGIEVCRRLKESPVTSRIPVIFLTAKTEEKDRIHGLEVFADDYLTKPWQQEELLFRVRNQLRTRRAQLQSNPLTGLPGSVLIDAELSRRIAAGEKFAFLMVDLDRFKSYNDYYGYARGDTVIRFLASILHTQVARLGAPADFVGHIGGDDFVIITEPHRARPMGDALKEEFDAHVGALYDEADRRRGYITVLSSRQGGVTDFGLMSVTIAIVTNVHRVIDHSAQVSDIAKDVKKRGKAMRGSVVLEDRRTPSSPPVSAPGTPPERPPA
jgi:PleD family two-component response regulator